MPKHGTKILHCAAGRAQRSALNADVRRIAPMLASVAKLAGSPERPIAAYAGAIVEFIAALPVYRTYLDAERPDACRSRLRQTAAGAGAAVHRFSGGADGHARRLTSATRINAL